MKTLKLFFGVGAVVALLGLNVVLADIKSGSVAQPEFALDTGDGTSLSPISFDTANNNEAQTTCAMTPGSPSLSQLLAEPIIPPQGTESLTQYEDMSPVSSRGLDRPEGPPPWRRIYPPPPFRRDDPPPPRRVVTPEPATALLIGLGIGGVAVVALRRWKKSGR